METQKFSGVMTAYTPPIHMREQATVQMRLKTKDKQRLKVVKMPADMWSYLCANTTYRADIGGDILVDSKVHDGTEFLPMILDKIYLVDTDLVMYKITTRKINNYGEKRKCITKFICPHHYKKHPQVRFADGVMYCNRCNRVITNPYEKYSSIEETPTGEIMSY